MKKLVVAAVLVGTGAVSYMAAAQDTNEVSELPPVTVYASRIGDVKDEMPAMVHVFTAEDIESSGVRDLP